MVIPQASPSLVLVKRQRSRTELALRCSPPQSCPMYSDDEDLRGYSNLEVEEESLETAAKKAKHTPSKAKSTLNRKPPEWSRELQDLMINNYRSLTHLYDKSHPNYRNKTLKDKYIAKFAAKFEVAEAKLKMWMETNRALCQTSKQEKGQPK